MVDLIMVIFSTRRKMFHLLMDFVLFKVYCTYLFPTCEMRLLLSGEAGKKVKIETEFSLLKDGKKNWPRGDEGETIVFCDVIYFKLRAKRPVWKLRNDPIQNLSVCLYECVSVCLSVRPSVFYLSISCV